MSRSTTRDRERVISSAIEKKRSEILARKARKEIEELIHPLADEAGIDRPTIYLRSDTEFNEISSDLPSKYPFLWSGKQIDGDNRRVGEIVGEPVFSELLGSAFSQLDVGPRGDEIVALFNEELSYILEFSSTDFFAHLDVVLGFIWHQSPTRNSCQIFALPRPRTWTLFLDKSPSAGFALSTQSE